MFAPGGTSSTFSVKVCGSRGFLPVFFFEAAKKEHGADDQQIGLNYIGVR